MEKIYWGDQEQYGPFSPQEDGWPNAGEVIRYYRMQAGMSAVELGKLYGEYLGEIPLTGRWIQLMEKKNLVPTNLSKRRALASLLAVPPVLLGLDNLSSLSARLTPTTVIHQSIDPQAAARELDMYWTVDRTGSAIEYLPDMYQKMAALRAEAGLVTGPIASSLLATLAGYYTLTSTIYADMCKYPEAYNAANESVSIAKSLNNNKLLAAALYQRGFVLMEQGYNATYNPAKIEAAIVDFNLAIPLSTPKVEAHVQLDLALAHAFQNRSRAAESSVQKAVQIVGRGDLTEGNFFDHFADINVGRLLLGQATVYTNLGRYNDASDILDEAMRGINPTQTRRKAWALAMLARIQVGQNNYLPAATTALDALRESQSVGSQTNVNIVQKVYKKLVQSNASQTREVRELGAALMLV